MDDDKDNWMCPPIAIMGWVIIYATFSTGAGELAAIAFLPTLFYSVCCIFMLIPKPKPIEYKDGEKPSSVAVFWEPKEK